jgi:hypothetical protein
MGVGALKSKTAAPRLCGETNRGYILLRGCRLLRLLAIFPKI